MCIVCMSVLLTHRSVVLLNIGIAKRDRFLQIVPSW